MSIALAPSRAAHAALVDTVLDLVARVDPRLERSICVGWMPRTRTQYGSALLVPPGFWYNARSAASYPFSCDAKRAPLDRPLARIALSAKLWPEMSPAARGETIAHELAHLSDCFDWIDRGECDLSRVPGHGIGWMRWCVRYAGRTLPVKGHTVRELTFEAAHDHAAVAYVQPAQVSA